MEALRDFLVIPQLFLKGGSRPFEQGGQRVDTHLIHPLVGLLNTVQQFIVIYSRNAFFYKRILGKVKNILVVFYG